MGGDRQSSTLGYIKRNAVRSAVLTLGHADLRSHHVRCPIEHACVLASIEN